jgi:hypothetical protein
MLAIRLRTRNFPAMFLRPFLAIACAAALATAQETGTLPEQPTPFSVWLDLIALSKPGAAKPALPIWFESFQNEPVAAKDGEPPKTVYRMRLRRMPTLHREILLRVFFDDLPGVQPSVSAWTESGRELFRGPVMGVGAGLPSSESATVPLDGADYLGVGPCFPSATKTFESYASPAFLREVVRETSLPAFAIGGISTERLAEVAALGITRVAVASTVTGAADPGWAAADLIECLGRLAAARPPRPVTRSP